MAHLKVKLVLVQGDEMILWYKMCHLEYLYILLSFRRIKLDWLLIGSFRRLEAGFLIQFRV
jgi:hypothetical protein